MYAHFLKSYNTSIIVVLLNKLWPASSIPLCECCYHLLNKLQTTSSISYMSANLRSPRINILCKHISQARHNSVMLKLIYVIAIIYYVSIFAGSNCLTHSYFTDIDQLNASTNLRVPLAYLDAGLS